MYPIAFEIFGKEIHYYGICIAVGFLISTCLLQWKRGWIQKSREEIMDMAMIALFTGIIGARTLHVIQNWGSHSGLLWIIRIDQGGLVFYGGFILAVICLFLYALKKKIDMLALLDIFAPAIAIAHAFGRLGCFMQGCCYGKIAPADAWYSVRFPLMPEPGRFPRTLWDGNTTFPLYPTQLWESIGLVFLCVFLLFLFRKFRKPGQIAGVYFIAYATFRFILEFFRADNPEIFLGLTTSQTIALFLMAPFGAVLLMISKYKKEVTNDPK